MASSKTFTCPYCFEKHALSEIQFRCINTRCPDFDDIEMTKYENGNINMPKKGKKTFPVTSNTSFGVPKTAVCPQCGKPTYKVICPSCHNALPESTLTGRDMIISIVGSRDTGKSHFVGVIINELINRIAPQLFGGSLVGFDDTMQRYQQNFARRLYVDLQKLDLTRSSQVDVNNGAYRPLIFTLNVGRKLIFKETIDSYTFVFFDTAGEDLNDEDTMNTVNRYICKSAGIIFLIDPLQIPAVANQLDENIITRASSVDWRLAANPGDIINRVSRLIRYDRNIKTTEKIKTPIAVVFSKYDVIAGIVPPGCTISEASPHCNARSLVLSDCHSVSSEIQSLLKNWGADAFITELNVNYSHYAYFAVSALGLHNNPKADRTIDRPRPHRIEDPFLFLMKENGVFDGKGFYRPPRKPKVAVKALIAGLVFCGILGILGIAAFFINNALTRGSLIVHVQEEGTLYLNDKLIGTVSPDEPKRINGIDEGKHLVRIDYQYFFEEEYINIESNREFNLTFSFRGFFVNTIGIDLNYIPAGVYTMGSSVTEPGREDDETPHDVGVDSFYMGQTEITQAKYAEVMGYNPSYFTGADRPVEMVTWYDAINFCNALSDLEALERAYTVNGTQVTWNTGANGYRLPTEAEWEFACRAGTATAFNTGNTISTDSANYNGSATVHVQSFSSNAWGLYDMHGNVREWCFDVYGNYSAIAEPDAPSGYYIIPARGQMQPYPPSYQTPPSPPSPPPQRLRRVVRGGSWGEQAVNLRSAFRGAREPEGKYNTVGFRIVRTFN
ncbi:MAG: formylglycine-generating enzyme family protein [Treponema sp.]|jgi:formylglycine-generating enzyme required for sulfatase activity|nr:formylglycine-generating enzyme family protein [Treponema sp.]